jgi:hypothetical protein
MTDDAVRTMRRAITASFFVSAIFYLLFAHAPTVWVAALCVIGAHAGGSIQWVFSTTLVQMTMSLSTYFTGWALDAGLSPQSMATVLGLVFLAPGALWSIIERRLDSSGERAQIERTQIERTQIEAEPAAEASFPPGD